MPAHTDKVYEQELNQLKARILKMGGLVAEMIDQATRTLVERSAAAAEAVFQKEPPVNQMEMEIDEACIRLLALRQPAASDLRFITIGLKISKDLERMGDLAVNIAERAGEINKEPLLKPYIDLPQMAEQTQKMVRDALNAFVRKDVALAQSVCEVDDVIDATKDRLFAELVGMMQKDSNAVSRGTHLIAVANQFERIADHATNIAEEVIYMVRGKDIRHQG